MGKKLGIVAALFASAAIQQAAMATPSGLDNIPTADTPPDKVVVLQAWDTFGDKAVHDFNLGMKFGVRPWGSDGWAPRFEGGLDSSIFPGASGPIAFQGKVAVHPWEQLPTFCIGSANLELSSADRDKAGEPFNYLVLTEDLNVFRLHAGYAVQTKNNAGFFGIDKSIKIMNHDVDLCADAIQTNDQHYWLASVGTKVELTHNLMFEGWTSIPVDHGTVSFLLKLDWIFGN